jgi:hypothetical protein
MSLTTEEAATANLCTQDFIKGVKYAIKIAKAEKAEILAEAYELANGEDMANMMDEIDALDGQAQAVQGVISKLQLRLFVMEAEGWIPEPEHLTTKN